MDKAVKDFMIEKTHELMEALTCNIETKEAARRWLDALGTESEENATQNYIKDLEGDIMPIDMLIAFSDSPDGAQVFGAEKAKEVAAHAREIEAGGAKYCDCPACAAAEEILKIQQP